ncbi:MAG: cysteine hydrolase [Bacilli bacterium]|nr:cysteine hydrolase [Bacilli bacterium]
MKINIKNKEDLQKIKELLIVIDMVNGFVKEGALAAPSIMRIVPRQIHLLDEALVNDDMGIVFIRDNHNEDAIEFKTYGPHCINDTFETELISELKKYEPYSYEYLKNSTNLIFAKGLQDDLLKLSNLEKIYLMGCLSDVCVLNGAIGLRTYFDELNKDIEILVYEDAIDTYNAPNHDADKVNEISLEQMKTNGIKILRRKM